MGQSSTKTSQSEFEQSDLKQSEFKQFSDLPPELQQQILNKNAETIRLGSHLNKNIAQLMEQEYFQQFCSQPLSNKEIMKSLDRAVSRNFLYFTVRTTGSTTGSTIRVNQIPRSAKERQEYSVLMEFVTMNIDIDGVDVYTEYKAYSNRLSCTKIMPDYAKSKVLSTIDLMSNADPITRYTYAIMNAAYLRIIRFEDETLFKSVQQLFSIALWQRRRIYDS